MALRHFRLARLHFLRSNLSGEILQAYLAIPVHQYDQRLRILVLHHKRFDDGMFVNAQLLRGLGRASMLNVVVEMLGEIYAVLAKK